MLCAVAIVPGAAVIGAGIGVDVEGVPIVVSRFGDVLVIGEGMYFERLPICIQSALVNMWLYACVMTLMLFVLSLWEAWGHIFMLLL